MLTRLQAEMFAVFYRPRQRQKNRKSTCCNWQPLWAGLSQCMDSAFGSACFKGQTLRRLINNNMQRKAYSHFIQSILESKQKSFQQFLQRYFVENIQHLALNQTQINTNQMIANIACYFRYAACTAKYLALQALQLKQTCGHNRGEKGL